MAKEKNKGMTDEEIERRARDGVAKAQEFAQNYSPKRMASWERYYGRKLGNEKKGRSEYIARDVMDCVEWMLPYFIRKFTSGYHWLKIKIKGQPDWVGEALYKRIIEDQNEGTPNYFSLLYQWMKDALVSGTAGVKPMWQYDEEPVEHEFKHPISIQQMQQLMTSQDVEVMGQPEMVQGPMGAVFENVRARGTRVKDDRFGGDSIPHWEILLPQKGRSINDDTGKGQKTEVTIDYLKRIDRAMRDETGEPYFQHLDELEEGSGGVTEGSHFAEHEHGTLESEEQSYKDHIHQVDQQEAVSGPGRVVDLVEWYERMDVDGDGFLEDVTVWIADQRMIRWEVNEDGFIPMSLLSPIIDCYKIHGIGWAELLIEIQNLKTVIIRNTIDSFAFTNSGRWRVEPGANVDVKALMDNAPGAIVWGKENTVEDLSPRPMDVQSPMGVLSIIDSLKEERSGMTKLSQGRLDPGQGQGLAQMGQTPDRSIARLMSQAEKRMDMVARIFAETGLADFVKKAIWLYQRHLQGPFEVEINGQQVQVSPEQIQGKCIVTPQLEVEQAVGMQEAQKISSIFGFITEVGQGYPAIMHPQKVHGLVGRYVEAMGEDAGQYIPTWQEFQQGMQNAEQQQAEQQQAMQQMQEMQMQLEQMDRQLKAQDQAQGARQDAAELAQKERDSIRQFQGDILELMQKGRMEEAKQMLERSKLRFEAVSGERDRQMQQQRSPEPVQGE